MCQVLFDGGATSFTLTGSSMKLKNIGGNTPKIENGSSSSQSIQFANIAFDTTGEVNPVSANLTVSLQSGMAASSWTTTRP